MRARGAVEVSSLQWKDGNVTALTLTARKDVELTLRYNGTSRDVSLADGEQLTL